MRKITAEHWVICGMRKVALSDAFSTIHGGCKGEGGGKRIVQNIDLQ